MANKHQIQLYANTSATAEDAPYLGKVVELSASPVSETVDSVSKMCNLPAVQIETILGCAAELIADLQREMATFIALDGFAVRPTIGGSFDSADAAFDAAKNTLKPTVVFDSDVRNACVNDTVTIVGGGETIKVVLHHVMDEEQQKPYEVIHGTNPFLCQGLRLASDTTGEYVASNGVRTALTKVGDVTEGQIVKFRLSEAAEAGDGKVVLRTTGGVDGGTVQTVQKSVKVLAGPQPVPAPTAAIDNVTGFVLGSHGQYEMCTITGENFGGEALDGDGVWYKSFLVDGTTREGQCTVGTWGDGEISMIGIDEEDIGEWALPEKVELTLKTHAGVPGSTQQVLTCETTAS